MKVLFLILRFPNLDGDNNLYGDLVLEFKNRGHEVYVATLLEKRRGERTHLLRLHEIDVLYIKCPNMFNIGFIQKGFSLLVLQWKFHLAIKKYWRKINFDCIIYPTPPISVLRVIKWLRKKCHSQTYLILRDIFPQNAVDVGLLKKGYIYKYFRAMEKSLYSRSDQIGCMSKRNIEYILAHNSLPSDKLKLLPNWKKIGARDLICQKNYRLEYGLEGRIIAIFGGVIGISQELEFLLELAKSYRESREVVFLIVGEGNRKQRISEIIARNKLSNVMLKGWISTSEYAELLRNCDIGLINLSHRFTIPNIPSKVLDYFEAGIPVLAAIDASTDFGQILEESQSGYWCLTGDLDSYRGKFQKLVQNEQLRHKMGQNGRRFLEDNLTVERTYQAIVSALK